MGTYVSVSHSAIDPKSFTGYLLFTRSSIVKLGCRQRWVRQKVWGSNLVTDYGVMGAEVGHPMQPRVISETFP